MSLLQFMYSHVCRFVRRGGSCDGAVARPRVAQCRARRGGCASTCSLQRDALFEAKQQEWRRGPLGAVWVARLLLTPALLRGLLKPQRGRQRCAVCGAQRTLHLLHASGPGHVTCSHRAATHGMLPHVHAATHATRRRHGAPVHLLQPLPFAKLARRKSPIHLAWKVTLPPGSGLRPKWAALWQAERRTARPRPGHAVCSHARGYASAPGGSWWQPLTCRHASTCHSSTDKRSAAVEDLCSAIAQGHAMAGIPEPISIRTLY